MRTAIGRPTAAARIQVAYNEEHGITPETIVKGISDITEFLMSDSKVPTKGEAAASARSTWRRPRSSPRSSSSRRRCSPPAEELRFEYAARLRDEIRDLRRELDEAAAA
jgi:excinuclease ABC subunit B